MTVIYLGAKATDIAAQGSKWRLALRDSTGFADVLLGDVTGAYSLEAKAKKMYESLGSSSVAYPVSTPLVGEEGAVFVLDIRLKTQLPGTMSVGAALAKAAEYAPGCELIRAAAVPATENSTQAVANRQAFFRDATQQDAQLDATEGVSGIVHSVTEGAKEAGKQAAWGFGAVLAVAGLGAWVYLRRKRR